MNMTSMETGTFENQCQISYEQSMAVLYLNIIDCFGKGHAYNPLLKGSPLQIELLMGDDVFDVLYSSKNPCF